MSGAVQKDTELASLAQARRCCYSSNMDAEMVHNSQPMQLVTIFRQQQTLLFAKTAQTGPVAACCQLCGLRRTSLLVATLRIGVIQYHT